MLLPRATIKCFCVVIHVMWSMYFAVYGEQLMENLINLYEHSSARLKEIQLEQEALVPAPVCEAMERPSKAEAVAVYEQLHGLH